MSSDRKTAVITGASRGIGAGIARVFAREKYDLALVCQYQKEKMEAIAEDIRSDYGLSVLTFSGDVSSESFVSRIAREVKEQFGHVDVLVNNAGIWKSGLVTDMSLGDWHNIIDVNLTSVFLMCRAFTPIFVSQKYGSIVNISSIWGNSGSACETVYSASKGGVNAFSKALAKELAPSGISVNVIAPGVIDTQMNISFSDEELNDLKDKIPMGRFGKAEEVGKSVLSVVNSPYTTGQVIVTGGGME